ncbi:MAG: biotin-dependent carboxyltransferase family protein [Gemmatimonadales bacterium]
MTVHVGGAGLFTTVQDLGRPTHQREGVPAGGAMDRLALRVANLLVGNDDSLAALETTLIGPTLVFEQAALIALAGADLDASIDDEPVPPWKPAAVAAGATLRFGKPKTGCRAYLAIAGGIDVPTVFGSRGTYTRAAFGGLDGRALRAGDRLALSAPSALSARIARSLHADGDRHPARVARWSAGIDLRPPYASDVAVRVIAGAHTDALSAESRAKFHSTTFRVSSSSDRMGYRLEGHTLALRQRIELLSEGVAFGTVQLPPDGAPIVLMADRQTTGGYPRIGEVASVDLPLVAQLKPGDGLRFRPIDIEEAQRLYVDREQELTQARMAIGLRFGWSDR